MVFIMNVAAVDACFRFGVQGGWIREDDADVPWHGVVPPWSSWVLAETCVRANTIPT